MKIWVVVMVNRTEPERKVYLVGGHSSCEGAERHRRTIEKGGDHLASVVELEVDRDQSPIVVGVAGPDLLHECRKNTPNG